MIENLNAFATAHPFLSFLIIVGIIEVGYAVLFRIPNRIIRHLNIKARGWPPEHLDSDGDFKPAEDEE